MLVVSAQAAATFEVPCKKPGTAASQCTLFSAPCQQTFSTMIDSIERTLQAKYDGLAQGRDLSLFETDTNGQPKEWKTSPSCEVLRSPPEKDVNYKGVSCGNTARITANGIDLTQAKAENSYKTGALVSAIKCYWQTAKSELLAEGKISDIPVACQGLADDLTTLVSQSNEAWESLLLRNQGASGTKNFCSAKMIRDFSTLEIPETCRDGSAAATEQEVAEVTDNRQGACYLAAARSALYDATQRLTLCTVFKKAELSWRSLFEGDDNPFDAAVAQEYSPAVASHTRGRVRSSCRPFYRRRCIRRTIEREASGYHSREYVNFMRRFLAPRYPSNAPQGGACHKP